MSNASSNADADPSSHVEQRVSQMSAHLNPEVVSGEELWAAVILMRVCLIWLVDQTLETLVLLERLLDIKGFISIPDIFTLTTLRSRRLILRSPIIDLRKSNIDILITTCPLSVDVKTTHKNSISILQMIMVPIWRLIHTLARQIFHAERWLISWGGLGWELN